jgi:hypothetical protein
VKDLLQTYGGIKFLEVSECILSASNLEQFVEKRTRPCDGWGVTTQENDSRTIGTLYLKRDTP